MPSRKKIFSYVCIKCSKSAKKDTKNAELKLLAKKRYFWVNSKDVGNWAQMFDKCNPEKQKYRQEVTPNTEYQRFRVFVQNDLVERKIKSRRKSSKSFLEFISDPNVVIWDDQDIISALQVAFEGEITLTPYCTKNKRLDVYFSKYKLGIEIDEYNHEGRNSNYEESRQLMIETHGITVIRTNPDAADFDINRLINQIYTHIIESTKKQTKVLTKKSLIDDLSKRLLELEFKQHNPIKSKCLKWIVKNILPNYKK